MPKARSPDREKAFAIYQQHGGKIELVDIAAQLNLSAGTIRGWKNKDAWDAKLNGTLQSGAERSKRAKGGQPGNDNAVGHGAPLRNKNAEKHGFFAKWLPEETLEIIDSIEQRNPLDLLWDQISIQYAAIIRAQSLMYVRDQKDITATKISESSSEMSSSEGWEVQQAWDKQANFLQAQSKAMTTLNSLIKRYEEMLRSDLATEEQQLRVDKLRLEIDQVSGDTSSNPLADAAKRMATRRGEADG